MKFSLLRRVSPLLAVVVMVAMASCSDDENDRWDGTLEFTVTSNAPTNTTAQINIKSEVLDLYEQAVLEAISDKGYEPFFNTSTSVITVDVGTRSKRTVCDNYIEAACLQLEDEVETTSFTGNIVVTNSTTGGTIYSCVFK